ncbi:hypothetical protein IP69_08010 [Bosea sp. AAP35]|uniref:DUF4089 domain-containing protein n=1 Tax=Bosea sp. AAP35 TaxID=1523417 RepID=UPI0006B882D2|nr:DUF4089 domain-containing protein [Bosea sp. AAP35]KPF71017.1 hypothetical protein IP69_08010 [Bosea sp. AAP35]
MSQTDPAAGFDPARHLDAIAPALGLTITDQQRPGVLQFLAIAQGMAAIVGAAPLDQDSLELAGVFRPGVVERAR